jgi:pyruvate,orthophosphate dikinase
VLTYGFAEDEADRAVLGGKGAGLARMVALGLPVPPGFVIGAPCGQRYLSAGQLPAELDGELAERLAALEAAAGQRFGAEDDPLLVSVRSGAAVSMPGMMDTVLNVGLTTAGADSLAQRTGDPVLRLIEDESGAPFPDADGQLREAIEAVFRSWHSPRARAYRRHKGIDDELGTAVVVQAMVFGNRDNRSGSGVAFTRDPSTGAPGAYGDFLFNAQGEDVVSGERNTEPLAVLHERLPEVYQQLTALLETLEQDARDLCDVEFTVQSGRLYLLQTRVGQRSGRAAVAIATALVEENMISIDEALRRVDDEQLEAAAAPRFADEPTPGNMLARGLAAAPGAAVGAAAFHPERAIALRDAGQDVVLLRPTTAPADLPGLLASVGVVTGRGGRTSHAAVVARGLGRPAVCGVGELVITEDRRVGTLAGQRITEGEQLSVDGDRGVLCRGRRHFSVHPDAALARFLRWRDAVPASDSGAELL